MCGKDDNDWPMGDGGGPNTSFVQENGTINPLPGNPASPEVNQQADNDYYFAGEYSTVISSVIAVYGDYAPVGTVSANEEAAERAFAGGDNDLRYHFNLPDTLLPTDLMSVTFDALNLDGSAGLTDPRYGIEVYFNGVLVQTQIVIRSDQLNKAYTTPQFTLASVNAEVGPGADNIVSLKGISYSADGGGSWMGIDYVQLNNPSELIPPPVFPWAVGKDDNDWPVGDGGGPNETELSIRFREAQQARRSISRRTMTTTSPAPIRQSSPATVPTHRSVWFLPTKRPPSAPLPATTMICAITSTFPTP